MPDPRQPDPRWRQVDLEHQLAALRAENQRLRNLLKVTDGVQAPPEQPMLAPPDPGLVTTSSPAEVKLALYARLFAAREDVNAKYWENPRKGTKGWSPVVRDPFRKGSLCECTHELLTGIRCSRASWGRMHCAVDGAFCPLGHSSVSENRASHRARSVLGMRHDGEGEQCGSIRPTRSETAPAGRGGCPA